MVLFFDKKETPYISFMMKNEIFGLNTIVYSFLLQLYGFSGKIIVIVKHEKKLLN